MLDLIKDMAHFKLDLAPILARAAELDVKHVRHSSGVNRANGVSDIRLSRETWQRHPIRDFDPLSLRRHVESDLDSDMCLTKPSQAGA